MYGQGGPNLSGSVKGRVAVSCESVVVEGTGSNYNLFKKCSASYGYCHGSFTADVKPHLGPHTRIISPTFTAFHLWQPTSLCALCTSNTIRHGVNCRTWKTICIKGIFWLIFLINMIYFIFCWLCILLWFLVNDQLDAQFFPMYLFQFSKCFEQPRAHHQGNQFYKYHIWYMPFCVSAISCAGRRGIFRPAHEMVTDTGWRIPDMVLIQLILLMMSTRLLETCREFK